FEKATGTCRTFLKPEGLPHGELNRASHYRDKAGNLYFGGLNGYITFHPKDLLNVTSVSLPVQLTRFEAINENTGMTRDLTGAVVNGEPLILDPQTSSFLMHYALLDFGDPHLKRYAYRIDGLHTNWTYLRENFLRITGLKGGA